MRIGLDLPDGARLREAVVRVAGSRRQRLAGHRRSVLVSFGGRPPGIYAVRIDARARDGRRFGWHRVYRLCRPGQAPAR